jgi:GNAT superfamily N-acetyltransferase
MDLRELHGAEALSRYAAIHNAVHPDDRTDTQELGGWLEAMQESALWFVGEVAVGWVVVSPWDPLPEARILVLEEHRRQGIGGALFDQISHWLRVRGRNELDARVRESAADGVAFARDRGFAEIGRELGLELDLRGLEAPVVEAPAGIELATWAERPDATRGIYEVYREAVPDVPGEEETGIEPFDDWLRIHMQGPTDDPGATFLALSGDEVVGFSKFALSTANPTIAFHDLTGVRRDWRGRGIAGTLKAAQIRWAKEQGYELLRTQNEERNAPIRRLNERFGYTPGTARLLMRGPVSTP